MLLWYSHVLCISVLTFSYIGTPGPSEDGTGRRGRSIKDRVTFVSGNPMVDVTHGILHLYKEKYDQQFFCVYLRTHLLYCIHGLSYSNLKMLTCILMKEILMFAHLNLRKLYLLYSTKTSLEETESRSEMLCMLAVPTCMTIHDLLQFTAPCYSEIQHMRIIRDPTPNQYMVLIKFRTQVKTSIAF